MRRHKSSKSNAPVPEWVRSSTLVSDWERIKREIHAHKWIESEKAGYDIGWDRAAAHWFTHHHGDFQRHRPRGLPR